jgi:hypothetical protein
MSHPAPVALSSAERTWNLLCAAALIPWWILFCVCATFWMTVVLIGVILLTESAWYSPIDSHFLLAALAFMSSISYATVVLRERIVAFFTALAAALFIRLFPRESAIIPHPAIFRSSYPPQNKSAA